MTLRNSVVALGFAAGAALWGGGCEEGQPGIRYRCPCLVTCDGQQSAWTTEVCKKDNDPHAAADVASENCEMVQGTQCTTVTCRCTDCVQLEAVEEC